MKRIKIWLTNFTLIQQFLAIVFLTVAFLAFFIFAFLNKNIDSFVNNQMFQYIHREQQDFLKEGLINNENSSVINFVYNASSKRYLNDVGKDYEVLVKLINIDPEGTIVDNTVDFGDELIVYSIMPFDKDFRLISIVKNDYRNEFRDALLNGVVNITFYTLGGLIALILMWVVSLIRPLNQIKNYINRIRYGENAELAIGRSDEIGEVAEAIVTMNNELLEQQHIRDEMIQNISHDLKTPIATIKSYSESIKDGVYPYGTLEQSVDVISENAERLEKKVYSLITFNKVGYLEDTKDIGILNLEMAPIVEKAILGCSVLRNDISFATDIDESVYFHGEEEPWRTVVENLLDNALRYAKRKVKITLADGTLEVYNDGECIEQDRLDKLFKPYEKGTKGKFGLGLSIVKKVCETYGYNVTGENMADGVVFRIYTTKKMKKAPKKKAKKV